MYPADPNPAVVDINLLKRSVVVDTSCWVDIYPTVPMPSMVEARSKEDT